MKWILILIWSNDGSMMGAQFGPMVDRPTCERVKTDLTKDMTWEGVIRSSCALVSIDPAQLPKVEVQAVPKARE